METGRARILLVDEIQTAVLVRLVLARRYAVDVVPRDSLIPAIQARPHDLVIVRISGSDSDQGLLATLFADPVASCLPVILIGAQETEDFCLDALEAGAADYLLEPVHARTLAVRAAACLASSQERQEAARREAELLAEAAMALEALGPNSGEARWRLALAAADMGTWRWDLRTGLNSRDAILNRIFGLPAVETSSPVQDTADRIHPSDWPQVAAALDRALANRTLYRAEFRLLRPDGTVRWLSDRGLVILGTDGAAEAMTGAVMDITDRKRAEEALRESEERFRLATQAINGLVYDWDIRTGRVERSQGLEVLLGYDPQEVGADLDWWKQRVHPDDRVRVEQEIGQAVSGKASAFSVEFRVQHRDGHFVHVWDKGLIVRDAAGRALRAVGNTLDVTDRQQVEDELRRAHDEAHAANEAKDRFLATLSHELRTPLTPVLAVLSGLEQDPRLVRELGAELGMIRRNVELEARLIDDLLDLTRIARGKLELRRRETDARQVLEHALATAAPELEARHLSLATALTAPDHLVRADAPRLTQVFWNLLSNAVKFTPPGGSIAVHSRSEGGQLVLEVTDTGIGIEPEMLPRIFDAFEQTDRRITRRFGGLGLGLAVSRAIVELHGGRLTAESAGRDRGSTFTVRLPVDSAGIDLDETGIGFARPRAVPAPTADRSLHILLVEDHADTAAAMADLLGLMGHRVTAAATVASALHAAGTAGASGFDLVLSDLGLPDGSGHDLMRELAGRGLPGIALSGYGMEEDIRKSQEAGFARHLTKPIDFQALRAAIREVAQESGTGLGVR